MKLISNISALKNKIREIKRQGKSIGFVPTMGALHEGHISLMRQARKDNDVVIVSIFVNPMQFGPKEDYKKYPRTIQADMKLMAPAGVDIVFTPQAKDIFPDGFRAYVDMSGLTNVMCGKSRPGHFRGVLTVVNKLFNLVEPNIAYFGQKDYQQALLIKQMVRDLDMNLKIKVMPIIREKDGLAMSSRNAYLSPDERRQATCLSRALTKAKMMVIGSEYSSKRIITEMKKVITREKPVRIDYIVIVNTDTLEEISVIKQKVLIALAVFVGKTRLIDNLVV